MKLSPRDTGKIDNMVTTTVSLLQATGHDVMMKLDCGLFLVLKMLSCDNF